jgi:hypothetical protein
LWCFFFASYFLCGFTSDSFIHPFSFVALETLPTRWNGTARVGKTEEARERAGIGATQGRGGKTAEIATIGRDLRL